MKGILTVISCFIAVGNMFIKKDNQCRSFTAFRTVFWLCLSVAAVSGLAVFVAWAVNEIKTLV